MFKSTLKCKVIEMVLSSGDVMLDHGPFELEGHWPVSATFEFLYEHSESYGQLNRGNPSVGDVYLIHPFTLRVVEVYPERYVTLIPDTFRWRMMWAIAKHWYKE